MELQIGTTLCGRYRVEGLLGSGSYGDVVLARHTTLDVCRAIKIIESHDQSPLAIREADILKRLRHPAIPLIYDVEVTPFQTYIIEEYVQGEALQSIINSQKTISYGEVIQFGLQLCDVVEYLHAHGICHQDIKPDNIIVDKGQLRLIDYSSAIAVDEKQIFHTGTRGYAAPEQYGRKTTGASADIYSIGVVLLMMATGYRTIAALDEVQPQALRKIVSICLSHAPKERYPSIPKLREALLALQNQENASRILHIHFAGVLPHCGTTHCAYAAAVQLESQHHNVLLQECNDSDAFRTILRARSRVSFHNGIMRSQGIDWLPNYYGAVELNLSHRYDRILYDDGVATEGYLQSHTDADYICFVCGSSPQELKCLEDFLLQNRAELSCNIERFRFLVNYANGAQYKRILRQLDMPGPIRVPYAPGW